MIGDAELAAVVGWPRNWRAEGDGAVYEPPGAAAVIRVRPMARPSGRDRYHPTPR